MINKIRNKSNQLLQEETMNKSPTVQSKKATYLINKYGQSNVELLLAHLEERVSDPQNQLSLEESLKLRDQIKYLRRQNSMHLEQQRLKIAHQIMALIQREKVAILQEFEEEWKSGLTSLYSQITQIEQLMKAEHDIEFRRLGDHLDEQLDLLITHQYSKRVYELNDRIMALSKLEDYEQAISVKKQLEQEVASLQKKKLHEWKVHKQKQLRNTKAKQEKELQGLRCRLEALFEQQIQFKNREFQKLLAKLKILTNRYEKELRFHCQHRSDPRTMVPRSYQPSRHRTKQNSLGSTKIMRTPNRNSFCE